jgi:hypothetical protein
MADLIYKHEARRSLSADPNATVLHQGRQLAARTLTAERNGNPILPDDVIAVLREECAKFPGPVASDEVFAIVLERTACRTQAHGMGLSRKSGGRHVTHPDPRIGDVAEDILQRQDGHHWDVFGGAAIGNPLNPGQGPSIGVINLGARPWVGPVCADAGVPTPQPPPPGPPQPPPPPAPTVDLSGVIGRLDALDSVVREKPSRGDIRQEMNELVLGPEVMGFLREVLDRLERKPSSGGSGCILRRGDVSPALVKALGINAYPERPERD